MSIDIPTLKKRAKEAIESAQTSDELEAARVQYLGRKKGEVTAALRTLSDMPVEKRREVGPKLQKLKKELESNLRKQTEEIERKDAEKERIDITAPGARLQKGHLHPLTVVQRDIRRIFSSMNFSIMEGPEVESEYYNFDALNIPEGHPAREMWDTFWLQSNQKQLTIDNLQLTKKKSKVTGQRSNVSNNSGLLLRTHTSPMQIRYMEEHEPPIRIVVPGRTFRYEATDASHEINFYQLEGLMVGEDTSLANFKFVVEEFLQKFFSEREVDFRYRPSYFPFVEPGLEVDIKLGDEWLEVMGAGMVHPRVFEYAGYNPRDLQGFAFGIGIDRLAMIKYNIPDIRLFYSGDVRFTNQF